MSQEIDDTTELVKIKDELEGKLRAKMKKLVIEAKKLGMAKYEKYETKLVNGDEITISVGSKTYFRKNDEYLISAYSSTTVDHIIECADIMKELVEEFNATIQKGKSQVQEVEKKIEEIKINV